MAATVAEGDVEEVLDVLLPLLPAGVHERQLESGRRELSWYGDAGALPTRAAIEARLPGRLADWRSDPAPADPVERRRRYGSVLVAGGRFAIRAPDAPPAPAGLEEVVVEAGHGQFGTSGHPTTMDSLELLLAIEPRDGFADLGCGAGVLGIVAARLGFSPVVAVDVEPGSVASTRANARRNGVSVEAERVDLLEAPPPPAATFAANLPLAVQRRIAQRLPDELRTVIVSGVVGEEADQAVAAYAPAGLRPVRRLDTAGWATILLERG